ncbi:MAG: ester cyclase [Solirubrobacteraceae bacterium]
MASSSVTARRYFDAIARHDLHAASLCWTTGAEAPALERFAELLAAFPDLWLEVIDTTTQRERCVVRWRIAGTFIGPGRVDGFLPNGAAFLLTGCDVLTVAGGLIVASESFLDGAELLRQLELVPGGGGLPALTNTRTRVLDVLYGAEPESVAEGVWVLRGGLPWRFNAFLIEAPDGLTVYDPGPVQMVRALRVAGVRLGGIVRVVLSHADAMRRGAASALGTPIYCHPLERSAAAAPSAYRDYWNLGLLQPWSRPVLTRLLGHWDGGPLTITGTVQDGDELAGFQVVALPGHAPGLIGLWRERDRLVLVSEALLTIDPQTGLRCAPRVPHPAFSLDVGQARESIRRIAALRPRVVWPGYGPGLSGEQLERQLLDAADAAA